MFFTWMKNLAWKTNFYLEGITLLVKLCAEAGVAFNQCCVF